MRGLGLRHEQIAGEIARRYRVRPREAHRLAHGWTLGQAAARFNARAAELGTDPDGLAGLAGNRLCEYEKWPHSERRPSVYMLVILAQVYQTGVLSLLDLADHEHLPPRDRLTFLQPGQAARHGAGLNTPAGAAQDPSQPGAGPARPGARPAVGERPGHVVVAALRAGPAGDRGDRSRPEHRTARQ
jgi:transcriptional regulator with XRE-family HTH domain